MITRSLPLPLLLSLALAPAAFAESGHDSAECSGGLCGTPYQTGGAPCVEGNCAGGCGGASILINNTDRGDTYQYSDDYDGDGFEDNFDNCPFTANPAQSDSDGDLIGDHCDNCTGAFNDRQKDVDGDGFGDACDVDADDDGIPNNLDQCWLISNPAQNDSDGDGKGNACDNDDDNDGVLDGADNCPLWANPDQSLPALDSVVCDLDSDSDGVPDSVDNCMATLNFEQQDMDHDGLGDACDGDTDGDNVPNLQDNCPRTSNASLLDTDRDGRGDVCDDRSCFVIDREHPEHCVDMDMTFTVMSRPTDLAEVGESKRLHIFANRDNAAMRYTWSITHRPDNSEARIENPRGSVTVSHLHEYHYLADQVARFNPDVSGDYELQLSAELVFPDEHYPDNNTSRTTMMLTVEDNGTSQGCVCVAPTGGLGSMAIVLLAGLMFWRRR